MPAITAPPTRRLRAAVVLFAVVAAVTAMLAVTQAQARAVALCPGSQDFGQLAIGVSGTGRGISMVAGTPTQLTLTDALGAVQPGQQACGSRAGEHYDTELSWTAPGITTDPAGNP